jgi:hypothetical protein
MWRSLSIFIYTISRLTSVSEEAMKLYKVEFTIPFRRGKTCIEGGNCFLFISGGERKAIVGELSVATSMVALEEQRYFDAKEIPIEKEKEPSIDAYRMARNLELYFRKKRPLDEKKLKIIEEERTQQDTSQILGFLQKIFVADGLAFSKAEIEDSHLKEFGEENGYCKLLIAPVSDEDKKKHLDLACQIEGKLNLTKAAIAADLEIPLKNIAFIPQWKFHIDMEMSVTPEGLVLLHDDRVAVEFLNEIEQTEALKEGEKELLEEYRNTAEEGDLSFKELQKKRIEILQGHKMEICILPAVFESARSKSALNYANGLFVRNGKKVLVEFNDGQTAFGKMKEAKFTYITTGPSIEAEKIFHRRFTEIFQSVFPTYTFSGLDDMSNFVATKQGGVHCLTFEESLPFE